MDDERCLGWYETSHSYLEIEDLSEKSEIFALGLTYEVLSGIKPIEGRDDVHVERVRKGGFPALRTLSFLGTVILKCWHSKY